MQKRNYATRRFTGLTLVEMVIAMSIMAVIVAILLPQLSAIQNSWDSQVGSSEALQNGRVLIEHLNHNLSKAVKITSVSDSSETNGYIEFEDSSANTYRYEISAGNYVEYGLLGDLNELAGPVSQLQFTCYDGNDFDVAITDVNSIRFIKVQPTITNAAGMAQDIDLITHVYLRIGSSSQGTGINMATPFEYDTVKGRTPALAQIDSTHYLCVYSGQGDDGWAVVLTVDTDTWEVSRGTPLEFDGDYGAEASLAQIDSTHFLCVYRGKNSDGWAVVLTVDTGTWQITAETPLEYDSDEGLAPAISQIDSTHYLCAYQGPGSNGWAVVLTVDTGTWQITAETPFEYDSSTGKDPTLAQIDSTHYLCVYQGNNYDGWAVVLTVNTGNWQITKETAFEYDTSAGQRPGLTQIDSTHYLCAYNGPGDDGWAVVLTVNTGTWQITNETPFEFDSAYGDEAALALIEGNDYFCAYRGKDGDGWATVLTVDGGNWTISQGTPLEYNTAKGIEPALISVDTDNYLCAYHSSGDDGWAVVLQPGSGGGDVAP